MSRLGGRASSRLAPRYHAADAFKPSVQEFGLDELKQFRVRHCT